MVRPKLTSPGVNRPDFSSRPTPRALVAGLAGLVFLAWAFGSALGHGFVFDDWLNYIENPYYRGLGSEQLRWMWSTYYFGHFIPLTWMTVGFDYTLWGLNPAGWRLTSLAIHGCNGLLFFLLLRRLLPRFLEPAPLPTAPLRETAGESHLFWAAVAGALFFLVHPLRVESVVYLTERRDLVGGFFALLCVLAYLRYVEAPPGRRWGRLAIAWLFFVAALLGKSIAVTLPGIFLILDRWPLRRWSWTPAGWRQLRPLLIEKTPFLASGALLLILMQMRFVAAPDWVVPWSIHPTFSRLLQIAWGAVFYLSKSLWPADLSPLYLLRPPLTWETPGMGASLVIFTALTILVIALARRWSGPFLAWLCFGLMAAPILGVFQAGPQIVADRYTYLTTLPFAVLLTGGLALAGGRLARSASPAWATGALVAFTLGLGAVLAETTRRETAHWRDSESLWTHAVQLDPGHYMGWLNLGKTFHENGRWPEAAEAYGRALEANPNYTQALLNRGILHWQQSHLELALADFNLALTRNPNYARAYLNRGRLRLAMGDPTAAEADFRAGLAAAQPGYPEWIVLQEALRNLTSPAPAGSTNGSNP